jgi:hypothetical protein
MNMTEEEARKKWCPQARLGTEASCNRAPTRVDAADPIMARCIASECMAWRFTNKQPEHDLERHLIPHLANEHSERLHQKFHRDNPLKGYCGLAGTQ